MTGFGRANAALPDGTSVTVLVRGVNHRFLDVAVKMRDELAAIEPEIRRLVQGTTTRGHVDVLVRSVRPAGRAAAFDEEAAARYAALWREAAGRKGLPETLTARDLLSLPGVVRTEESGEADEGVSAGILDTLREALASYDAARAREGSALRTALEGILTRLTDGLGRLDAERAGLSERLAASLRERIAKLAATVPLDEARLHQEVAMLADRAEVSEEIDRFRAHLEEIRRLLGGSGPVGKRLDHLAQELHRETNTSGQKVRELGATRAVLDLKAEVEAFKEQVQNIE